jgi:hypothetical protein
MNIKFLESLEYSWTAEVQLFNGQIIDIWYTALPSTQGIIEKVLSVSSDYPRREIKDSHCRCNCCK